ncbi:MULTISPECIES: amidohydrolase family protein [unclassified Bacillus (in: firmicutes)]|uniref:amidohydrolase family protein n=1 Tax=unclassified Bacillus (in: firmicutes) TaxID=185979 RepID=UPI000BEF2A3C|nr:MULTISPECIES: amidohydrolase family protein [unclassified Bacillus (in: firmicutes)]PEJ57629.1 hypothetical protein CN692_12125 [Bacillus sp. AFS002410]PEL08398.1 hypothetical protein CN601_16905 [Bacillus sp. AFS017336]
MTTIQQNTDLEKEKTRKGLPVIDCDIHEMPVSVFDLLPYMEEPWRGYLERGQWQPKRLPYTWPLPGGVDRLDLKNDDKNWFAGTDFNLMKREVLDKYNIKYAILTSLFYPSDTPKAVQPEFRNALASAYNDWVIENWLTKDDRLRGSICINTRDPKAAAQEIDRVGSHPKIVQIMMPVLYDVEFGDPYFHPIYEAAERNNLRISMHQSTDTQPAGGYPTYYMQWHTTMPQNFMTQIVSLITHGVFEKYPSLGFICLESGFTWLPHLMWRFDVNYRSLRREVPWLTKNPSEYIRKHFRFSTQPMDDPEDAKQLLQIIDMIGPEMLVFSTDYPHWDFDDPYRAYPSIFPKELKQRLLYDNAREFYGFE